MNTGMYQSIIKTARVVSIFQKGLKYIAANYEPISVLYNVDKIHIDRLQ